MAASYIRNTVMTWIVNADLHQNMLFLKLAFAGGFYHIILLISTELPKSF